MLALALSVLSISLCGFATASNCRNPLLNRAEVFERFGLANVLVEPRTASQIPVCKNEEGQNVCVSDEGFESLRSWLENKKNDFLKADSSLGNIKNLSAQAHGLNVDDCIDRYLGFILFSTHSLGFYYLGAPKPWNFDAAAEQYLEQRTRLFSSNPTQLVRDELEKFRKPLTGTESFAVRVTESKEKCAKSLFQHLIAVSCLASSADYGYAVSGTAERPRLKLARKTCALHKENCQDFFKTLEQVELSASLVQVCTNKIVDAVVSALRSTEKAVRDTQLMAIIDKYGISFLNKTTKGTAQIDILKRDLACDFFLNATSAHLSRLHKLANREMKEVVNSAQLRSESSIDLSSEDDGLDMNTDVSTKNVTSVEGIEGTRMSGNLPLVVKLVALTCSVLAAIL